MPIKIKSKIKNQKSKSHIKIQNCLKIFEFWFVILSRLWQFLKKGIGIPKSNFSALLLSGIFAFCILHYSYAAPSYGTNLPEKHKIFMGIENNTIFKRYLKDEYGKLRSTQYFLLLSYGIFDWLSIDLKGGEGNIKQHPSGSDEIDYPAYLGGGYGFRLKLYDKKNTKMVFGFQHVSIHPDTIYIGATKHKAVLDDWQFSTLASYDFKNFTPYLGARWSRLDYIHWQDGNRKRVKSDSGKSIGLILGIDLAVLKNFWINLEGSFFDSEAVAFSLNYSF